MKLHALTAVIAAAAIAAPAQATTVTVASFTDPSGSSGLPLFTYDATSNSLSGAWSGSGLTLEAPFGSGPGGKTTYSDVQFKMAPVQVHFFLLDAGTIVFEDASSNPILTITFASAWLTPVSFGATDVDTFLSNDVVFDGTAVGGLVGSDPESFSFAFANQVFDTDGSFTATASFIASATPGPATIFLFMLGGGVLACKKIRRTAARREGAA